MKKATSIKIAASSSELAAEYKAGATIYQLADKYGCSHQNIHARLINAGVRMRMRGNPAAPPLMKTCPTCGKTFHAYVPHLVFCSNTCVRHKNTCVRGHPLTDDNRYTFPSGRNQCKECHREHMRQSYARKKQAS